MSPLQLEFFLLGLVLGIIGAVLLFGRRSRLIRALSRLEMRDATVDWPMLQGLVLVAVGILFVAGTVGTWVIGQDPRAAAEAQATLDQALAESAKSGHGLLAPALREIYRNKPPGYEVRDVAFAARWEGPDDPPRSWTGQLTWGERRRPTDNWYARDCRASVTRSPSGAWDVNIIGGLCNPPSP